MAATAGSFGISLGVYAAWFLLMFFIFSTLRATKYFARFYCAKRYMSEADQPVRPRPLAKGFFGWVMPTLLASEDEVILTAGVDGAMYLRIFYYGLWFFSVTSIWVLIVVLPVNIVGNEVSILEAQPSSGVGTYSTLDKLTMSNIEPKSSRLWLHAVSTWVISLWAYHLLRRFSKDAVALHLKHLSLARRGAESHSIVVMDIPGIEAGSLYSKVDGLLFFLPKGLKAKVKAKIVAQSDKALQKAASLRHRKNAKGGDERTANTVSSLQGLSASQASINAGQERTSLGEPMGPSLDPKHPVRFVPVTELDAVSGAILEMEQCHESPEQMINREYEELYTEQLESIHPVYKPAAMSKLTNEYAKLRIKLIDLCDTYEMRMRSGKKLKRKSTRVIGLRYGEWGRQEFGKKPVKVDTLEWQIKRLDELKRQIQEQASPKQRQISSTAFVTFKTRQAQQVASSSMQHHDQRAWHTRTAPNPDTLIWSNLGMRAWERELRVGLIWAAFIALTLFYAIPVGAVQALVEVDRLQNIPVFKQLLQITFIRALLQSVFPSLVLRIFLLILPWLLGLMTKQEGVIDTAVKDARVSSKYFIFQVITVFIVSFISGSFFTNFETWIKNPSSAVTILGTAAPLQSIFFLSFVELNALFSGPLGFLKPVPLIKYTLMSGLAGTERKRYRVWANQTGTYGSNIPSHTITILLGTVFSVINPLLPPMSLVYFIVQLLINKYHLLYNTRPAYQSGGKMWSQITDQIITGLVFFQLIMTALLGVRKSPAAILVVFLIPLTILVRFMCFALFQRPLQLLSVRAAVDLDIHDKEEAGGELGAVDDDMYLHPGFKLDVAKHELLLEQAATMRDIVDGKRELAPLEAEAGEDVNTISSVDPLGEDEPSQKDPSQRPTRNVSHEDGEEDVMSTRDGLVERQRQINGSSAMV